MGTINDLMVQNNVAIKPTKILATMATGVRLVQYPDGRQVMQGAYGWTKGFESGFDWMDLPVIVVGVDGQEEE